jgi:hypothetical protein
VTLGDLLFDVAMKSGMDPTNVPDERTLLVRWANEGRDEVLLRTHCYVAIGQMTLVVGQSAYRTDSGILAVLGDSLTSQNQLYTLELVPLGVVRDMQRAQSTSPVLSVAIEGDLMVVYPTPTQADVINWDYVPRATDMTADANDPSTAQYGGIPKEFHKVIRRYMEFKAAEYDDKKFADTPESLEQKFLRDVAMARRHIRHKRPRQPMRPVVGYPGGSRISHRNDQDVLWRG